MTSHRQRRHLRRRLDDLAEHLGRRSVCLLLLGTAWVIIGIGIELEPPSRAPGELILHELLPVPLRAAMWASTGLVALVCGVRGRTRDDTVGFVAIMLMPLERTLSFLGSWGIYGGTTAVHRWIDTDVEVTGYERGWYGALVWLIVVILVQIIAGWRNPPADGILRENQE